jgi:hypothetical protein
MMSLKGRDPVIAGLGACIMGLVFSPYLHIATGALTHFQPAFGLITLPPFLLGSGFLIWRLLSKPGQGVTSVALSVLEGICVLIVLVFLLLISNYSFASPFDRLGLVCTFLLPTSACCLPLMFARDTVLQERLRRLPRAVSMSALVLIVALAGLVMAVYLSRPPRFP